VLLDFVGLEESSLERARRHLERDPARLRQHLVFDPFDDAAGGCVIGEGSVQIGAYVRFERARLRVELLLLRSRACDLTLVAVEDWQRRAEEDPVVVADETAALHAVILPADGVIDFAVCEL